jgi:hypothetical protein
MAESGLGRAWDWAIEASSRGAEPSFLIILTSLKQTCPSCPAQWEGRSIGHLGQQGYFYARARNGRFSAGLGASPDEAVRVAIAESLIALTYDGADEPTTEQMLAVCAARMATPDELAALSQLYDPL